VSYEVVYGQSASECKTTEDQIDSPNTMEKWFNQRSYQMLWPKQLRVVMKKEKQQIFTNIPLIKTSVRKLKPNSRVKVL
jgi:hypothetical protein